MKPSTVETLGEVTRYTMKPSTVETLGEVTRYTMKPSTVETLGEITGETFLLGLSAYIYELGLPGSNGIKSLKTINGNCKRKSKIVFDLTFFYDNEKNIY